MMKKEEKERIIFVPSDGIFEKLGNIDPDFFKKLDSKIKGFETAVANLSKSHGVKVDFNLSFNLRE